ncbi:YndJ family transporter [Paenibacillus sp. GCM10027627]|uniref:YndJ family transporter n=1 Tax=unclassified Paenibacillus TaxID=185978 RepID=UPI0036414522
MIPAERERKSLIISAIIGAVLSIPIFSLPYLQFNLVEKFILFAALVVVPLVVLLLSYDEKSNGQKRLYAVIRIFQLPAAYAAFMSVLYCKTWEASTSVSGAFSLVWLFFTLLLGLYGVSLIANRKGSVAEIAIGAGLIYFFVGGVWFVLYQYQVDLFHASPATHGLSSLHFHLSSAIVPIFIGMLGRMMSKKSWYPWVVAIDIIGPILIAIGIMFSKPVEYIGVALFACNIAIYTTYLLAFLRRKGLSGLTRKSAVFFVISSFAFYIIVVLSIFYPLLKKAYSLTIHDFIPIYGSLHAFGFVLCGLIGWIYMLHSIKKNDGYKI